MSKITKKSQLVFGKNENYLGRKGGRRMNVYEQTWDVVVAGGGVSGTVAAIAAGRCGARVLVLEQSGYLGGTLTGCGVGSR